MARGYTIIELLVVIGIFAVFFSFASLNLLGIRSRTSIVATTDTLVSDLRSQQIRSMSADTDGGASADNYGIFFGSNFYTLFKGTYSPGNANNFIVNLDEATINTSFAGSRVIFAKGSGEVSGVNTISVSSNNSSASKIITINRFGVVTGVN